MLQSPRTLRPVVVAFVMFGVVSVGGCERDAPNSREADGPSTDAPQAGGDHRRLSPIETVRRARRHRLAGELGRLEECLVVEQRKAVVDLVMSVDRLATANDTLTLATREHLGAATAETVDRPGLANIIGVFSRDVELIDEHVTGDKAVVTIQVAGRIPLEEIELVRRQRRWLIQTDPPVEGMTDALRRHADTLIGLARAVREGKYDAGSLVRELEARETSSGRRISKLLTTTSKP